MSKSSTEVATQEPAGLPDQAHTPSGGKFDASDIIIPRIKMGQPQLDLVQDGLVPAHSIFTTYGAEDTDPEVVVDPLPESAEEQTKLLSGDFGLLLHVVDWWKSWSATIDPVTGEIDRDGEFQTWGFNNPNAHPEADLVFNYLVVCPELDEGGQTPYRLVLSRTSTPAARSINTTLSRLEGPIYNAAFRLWCKKRESTKGAQKLRWSVAKVRPVTAKPDHVALAAELAKLVEQRPQQEAAAFEARESEPAI